MTGWWVDGARADEPMDKVDEEILRSISTSAAVIDPVPAGLVDRILFALTFDRLEAEMMELQELSAEPATIRGGQADAQVAETITFTSSGLSVMVTMSEVAGGVRIDGWVAPGGPFRIELHRPTTSTTTEADEDGRFVFPAVSRGRASLLIRSESPHQRSLATPAFDL